MNITLMTNKSPNNKIGKDLVTLSSVTGSLRETSSIIDPVFEISGAAVSDIAKLNYVHIPEFSRYYFVRDVISVRTGIWRVICHVDVLQTYEQGIRDQQAVVARQEGKYNLFLDDGTLKAYNNPRITTHKFPGAFNTQSFILAVAGG